MPRGPPKRIPFLSLAHTAQEVCVPQQSQAAQTPGEAVGHNLRLLRAGWQLPPLGVDHSDLGRSPGLPPWPVRSYSPLWDPRLEARLALPPGLLQALAAALVRPLDRGWGRAVRSCRLSHRRHLRLSVLVLLEPGELGCPHSKGLLSLWEAQSFPWPRSAMSRSARPETL